MTSATLSAVPPTLVQLCRARCLVLLVGALDRAADVLPVLIAEARELTALPLHDLPRARTRAVGNAAGLRVCTASQLLTAVLDRHPRTLAVMRFSAVAWRDLGTPRRLIKTLNDLGIHPE